MNNQNPGGKSQPIHARWNHGIVLWRYDPLNQVSSMTTPDARDFYQSRGKNHWSRRLKKSIRDANLGLNPQNDGQQVIVNILMLTEERRKQLVKQVSAECEHGKVSVRNIRKETNDSWERSKGRFGRWRENAEEKFKALQTTIFWRLIPCWRKKGNYDCLVPCKNSNRSWKILAIVIVLLIGVFCFLYFVSYEDGYWA